MKRMPIVLPMGLMMIVSLVGAARADARPSTVEERPRTEIVQYRDLNLASPAGVSALDRRIALAAERVCSRGGGVRDIDSITAEHRCRFQARRAAEQQRDRALALAESGPIRLSSRP